MDETIEKLKRHKSSTPSKWREAAEFRTKNRTWLRYSQSIAMLAADAMEEEDLTQKALAERMGCTQQYVSRILKGQENLTLETISKLETALGLNIISSDLSFVVGYSPASASNSQYLSDSADSSYESK